MTRVVTTCNLILMMGGIYQNQADPLESMRSRLEQAFEQAGAGSLAFDAWEDLCKAESDLENSLLFPQLGALQEAGKFAASGQILSSIADLLDRLAAIAGVLIEHHPGADYDSAKLAKIAETKDSAAERSIVDRAYGLIVTGADLGLSNDFAQSQASFREAGEQFRRLGSQFGSAMASAADGYASGSEALGQQLQLQLQQASVKFYQGAAQLEAARVQLTQMDIRDTSILSGIGDAIILYKISGETALFIDATNKDDFEEAAKCAGRMVQYANSPDDADLPPLLRQMTAVVRCNSSAYLSYTKAEIASNSQDWSEARQRLAEAEVHWHDAYTTAMGLGLPQSPQLALSTLALSAQLTGACSRRMSHEQELRAQIANLDLEVDQLNAEIRKLAERPTDQHNSVGGNYIDGNVAGSVTSGDNVQGSKVDGNIAGDVTEGDKFTGIKATDNAVVDDTNFSQLWQDNANKIDLPALSQQLGELYTQLESSGDKEHDPQISAVLAAQKAAEDGDGPKVLKWLRGAGGWVLDHAKDIAPIAATAIKIALGVAV